MAVQRGNLLCEEGGAGNALLEAKESRFRWGGGTSNQCREAVLRLAYEIPLSGHLGKKKTVERVLRRFYWPTLHRDVHG